MSLLREITTAKKHLETCTKCLLEAPLHYKKGGGKRGLQYSTFIAVRRCNAVSAKNNLCKLERKLSKIKNHAPTERMEILARVMLAFEDNDPKFEKEVDKILTFT